MKSVTFIVLDDKRNIHKIHATSLNDLFAQATDKGITVFDYEVEEGEDFE